MLRLSQIIALTLPLALAACGAQKTAAPPADAPIRISTAVVGQTIAAQQIEAAGTAALRREIPLGFTSSGRVARVLVQEGDRVSRGQLLATLDTTNVGASLEVAAAERDRAGAELARLKKLYAEGWITKVRLESAEASARSADANLAARRFSVQTARVVAPTAGIVLARGAEPSQVIEAGAAVVTLGDDASGFVLRVLLADRDAVRVRRGIPAEVRFDALSGTVLRGQVIEVGGKSDKNSGAFVAEIGLPADSRLRSGMVGAARIAAPAQGGSTRLTIPPTAIFAARADEAFVYVIDAQRRVRARRIALGPLANGGSEVLSGLRAGEVVAVSGLDRLSEGARVDPERSAP